MTIDKQRLVEAVKNDEAEFIEELHVQDDMFDLYFKFEGVLFSIAAHGNERWVIYDEDFVIIEEN